MFKYFPWQYYYSICDNLFEQKTRQTFQSDEKSFWIGYPFIFLRRKIYYGKQPSEVFCKKGVLRNFENFIGKHLCQSPFLMKLQAYACNFIKKETLAQVFSCKCCKIPKNTFFHRTPLVTVSVFPCCYVVKQFFEIAYYTDIIFWKVFYEFTLKLETYLFVFNIICSFPNRL